MESDHSFKFSSLPPGDCTLSLKTVNSGVVIPADDLSSPHTGEFIFPVSDAQGEESAYIKEAICDGRDYASREFTLAASGMSVELRNDARLSECGRVFVDGVVMYLHCVIQCCLEAPF
jgi:hypothetical protein